MENRTTGGRRHSVSFTTTEKWNRRRKKLGLTWQRAAENGIRDQELAERLRADRLSRPAGDASSPESAA